MPAAADDIAAKVQVCGACHGANGVPTSPTIPVIWGQQQNYLVKQLHDYRAEDRNMVSSSLSTRLAALIGLLVAAA